MRIITFAAIRGYIKKHADADVPLKDWYKKTERSDWTCLADMKQTFNGVDYAGNDRFAILKEMTTDWLRLCYLQQKKYLSALLVRIKNMIE